MRSFLSNCLLALLILRARGRVVQIFKYPGKQHWMGITRRGNLIHFKALNQNALCWWKPLFWGKLVVRRYVPNRKLEGVIRGYDKLRSRSGTRTEG